MTFNKKAKISTPSLIVTIFGFVILFVSALIGRFVQSEVISAVSLIFASMGVGLLGLARYL